MRRPTGVIWLGIHLKHIARKRFGQHFLCDAGIINLIVQAIDPKPSEPMVEIGPGLMALTQPLLSRLDGLTVIELDRDLARRLRSNSRLQVIESDVLKVDFSLLMQSEPDKAQTLQTNLEPPQRWRVVGNLPYNISSPILFHLCQYQDHIFDQHFMLQKEVVDRMLAQPKTAAYGRLSVMLQCRYAMSHVLDVPPDAFDPPPRVMSAVVRMLPLRDQASLDLKPAWPLLEDVVRVAFSQRRKLLRHSLGAWLTEKKFEHSFNLQRRAEEVSVNEYLQLARALFAQQRAAV